MQYTIRDCPGRPRLPREVEYLVLPGAAQLPGVGAGPEVLYYTVWPQSIDTSTL